MTESSGARIDRTFAATPEAVFDAWVTPASFAAWFGGSGVEVRLESVTMDARELVQVTFDPVDPGTRMVFHQTGGNLSEEDYERSAAGWWTFFDAMDDLLAA
jgi:uncharacterized protein YndB with AHSA1/START domain